MRVEPVEEEDELAGLVAEQEELAKRSAAVAGRIEALASSADPVLPPRLLDVIDAPVPYFVGISNYDTFMSILQSSRRPTGTCFLEFVAVGCRRCRHGGFCCVRGATREWSTRIWFWLWFRYVGFFSGRQ